MILRSDREKARHLTADILPKNRNIFLFTPMIAVMISSPNSLATLTSTKPDLSVLRAFKSFASVYELAPDRKNLLARG